MNKLLVAAAVAAFAAATPAFAADTGSTQVTAQQAQVCKILQQSGEVGLQGVNQIVDGAFTYTCNFIGNPVLKFTSANGGVKTGANGGAKADYAIYLNDAPVNGLGVDQWLKASNSTGGVSYAGNGGGSITESRPANTPISPTFKLALTEALPVAGD